MLDAHSRAGFVVGTPFSSPGLYDFAQHNTLTKQVSDAPQLLAPMIVATSMAIAHLCDAQHASCSCAELRLCLNRAAIAWYAHAEHSGSTGSVSRTRLPCR